MTFLRPTLSADAFATLTLEAQIDHLSALLPRERAESLVELCADVRDPAPLAWLCCKLADRHWLREEKNCVWLASFLIKQSETTVHKVLRAITELALKEDDRKRIAALMIAMLRQASMKNLSSICLVDRALRHHFPPDHDSYQSELLALTTKALRESAVSKITLAQLAQLPAASITALSSTAAAAGPSTLESFDSLREQLSVEAIEVLGNAPKAVSQANAEDLLARRVYTDPGHFLIELLQNAEDSGARQWKVVFDSNRIVVWHDGAHFDARDVVGVTSIGQTTKRKQQIGFFGVGFKSVYEVTDRPQIYSDVWKFEIAAVSIPKLLAQRPDFVREDGTVLVLPLRPNADQEHSPKALYEKAAQLDACVLLTLRSIDVIELELTTSAGGPSRHALIEGVRQERSSIRHEPSGNVRTYWIRDDRYEYDGKLREAGRPDETMVMVGLLFDEVRHKPIQLEDGAATVYSYLPTREKTGLKFFVQGHFDVPLDRERIAPDSEWNRWILSQVPHQLAQIAKKIGDDNDLKSAEGLLDVLPLQSELAPSLFQLVAEGLKADLQAIAFVPTADGALQAPKNILVAPPQIAALFQGKPVSATEFLLDLGLNTRAQELVVSIGAATFNTRQLLTYLERIVPTFQDGHPPSTPAFFSDFKLLENLYDILLAEADRLEREGATTELAHWLDRLRKLPIVMDTSGRLVQPQKLARASSVLRKIYQGIFTFVDERLETASARTLAFLNQTGVLTVDIEYMVAHLEKNLSSLPLPLRSHTTPSFPGSEERLQLILLVLSDAGWAHQNRAARLPLFKSIDGAYWPAATSSDDRKGVLRVWGPLGTQVAQFYGKRRPLANVDDARDPASVLLDRVTTPLLDLSVLCDDLASELFDLGVVTLRQLHSLLESVQDEISDKVGKQLCALSIWPDRLGAAHSLKGKDSVLIPENEDLCQLFPRASFLDKDICGRKHIKRLGVELISANHVAHGLTAEAAPPLFIPRTADSIERTLQYLLRYVSNLDSTARAELKEAKSFFSDSGELSCAQDLSISPDPEVRALYAGSRLRRFVKPDGTTLQVIRALGFEGMLDSVTAFVVISDLEKPQGLSLVADAKARNQILSYLAREAQAIPGSALSRLTKLPIFPDQKGVLGQLPVYNSASAPNAVRPCEGQVRPLLSQAGLRLLDSEVQGIIKPILDILHTPYAGLEDLVDYLCTQPQLPDEVIEPLQLLFIERKAELTRLYPVSNEPGRAPSSLVLNKLAIWKTGTGELVSAARVVSPGANDLLGSETAESKALQQRSISVPAFERLCSLAPLMAPMPCEQFVGELVLGVAHDKQSLSAQPHFLSTVEKINQVNRLIANQAGATPIYADATNCLRLEPLYYCDATTYAVLEQLPILQSILHPQFERLIVQNTKPQEQQAAPKSAQPVSRLSSITGFFKRLIGDSGADSAASTQSPPANPAEAVAVDCRRLPPSHVITALGSVLEEKRRVKFYAWLQANEEEIYADAEARKLLRAAPFFRTVGGAMVCPRDLIIETDLPDLGLDWFPSPEIPQSVLASLERRLDIGHPQLNDLITRNVVPAYLDACLKQDREKAGRLLQWLAQRLNDRSPTQIRDLVLPKDDRQLQFEDTHGTFRPLRQLIIPAPKIVDFAQQIWGAQLLTPSTSRYSEVVLSFLSDLGMPNTPPLVSVCEKLENPENISVCAALAGLVCYLRNQHGESILSQLPLQKASWLQNGAGQFKPPSAMFIRTADVECVAGSFPELYLADGLYELLGDALSRDLNFRDLNSITFEDVSRHIARRTELQAQPPFAVYKWLDQQVQKKRIDSSGLVRLFGSKPWIWTDDGEVFPHARVLGVRAFHLFKSRRGYWERGFKECHALCEALGIAGCATPNVVAAFVEELGLEAKEKGARKILAEEPALPHMLLSSFNLLAQADKIVDRDLPIIPCANSKNETELLPASAKNLFWSDTPTLDALFSKAGTLCLAMRGRVEEREGVEKFHELMGIRRLRDSFRLVADLKSGLDRTEQMSLKISELKSTLRALSSVLKRVELERPLAPPSAWVYGDKLRHLSETDSIKAAENFGVLYVLPGVGETRVQQLAIYDAALGQLIVDTRVLQDKERTGLAEGLIGAIVEGPLSDSFIDLVEILLARGTKERMNDYLNRRHFADAASVGGGCDHVTERIIEILDYGLDRQLKHSFPMLVESPLELWRHAALTKKIVQACAESDVGTSAHLAVPLMLEVLLMKEIPEDLASVLEKMLAASTLSDAADVLNEKNSNGSLVVAALPLTVGSDGNGQRGNDLSSGATIGDPAAASGERPLAVAMKKVTAKNNTLLIVLATSSILLLAGLIFFVFCMVAGVRSVPESVAVNGGLVSVLAMSIFVIIGIAAAVFAFVHFDVYGQLSRANKPFIDWLQTSILKQISVAKQARNQPRALPNAASQSIRTH